MLVPTAKMKRVVRALLTLPPERRHAEHISISSGLRPVEAVPLIDKLKAAGYIQGRVRGGIVCYTFNNRQGLTDLLDK